MWIAPRLSAERGRQTCKSKTWTGSSKNCCWHCSGTLRPPELLSKRETERMLARWEAPANRESIRLVFEDCLRRCKRARDLLWGFDRKCILKDSDAHCAAVCSLQPRRRKMVYATVALRCELANPGAVVRGWAEHLSTDITKEERLAGARYALNLWLRVTQHICSQIASMLSHLRVRMRSSITCS